MRKFVLFLVSSVMLTGCIKSEYTAKIVDMKSPEDTLCLKFIGKERWGMRGKDTKLAITTYNKGDNEFPLYINLLESQDYGINGGKTLYRSMHPIEIIEVRYNN